MATIKKRTLFIKISNNRISSRQGLSLIETTLYVGLLGIVTIMVANSLITLVSLYQRARAQREVLSNARLLMETMTKDIAYAQYVYVPTSRFNTANGQLSLVTGINPTLQHTANYLDIWSDGSRILAREEGKTMIALSSANVRVTQFRVQRIFQALGREAIKITLGVSSAAMPSVASTMLSATTALRGNY